MRGPARSLVKEMPLTSYEELKTLFKARFRLTKEDFHLAVRLRTLQQHGDNYEAYLRDFRMIANKMSDLSPSDKLNTFVYGLPLLLPKRCSRRNLRG